MTRVEHVGFPGRLGTVWTPKYANEHESFYEAAKAQGLTSPSEKLPDENENYHMVTWDDRPGVVEVRYLGELFVLPEPEPPPEPTERDKLITKVEHSMWHALHAAEDEKTMGAHVDFSTGLIDGHISLRPAAEAAMRVFYGDALEKIEKAWFGAS